MNPENDAQGFEQSTHDFHYRTWMRLGRPKPFDEWMKDRETKVEEEYLYPKRDGVPREQD